jgi:hypothetical protein
MKVVLALMMLEQRILTSFPVVSFNLDSICIFVKVRSHMKALALSLDNFRPKHIGKNRRIKLFDGEERGVTAAGSSLPGVSDRMR